MSSELAYGSFGCWMLRLLSTIFGFLPGIGWSGSRDRAGRHSIRINDQWRICFRWREGDAYDVEIVDYH